MALPVEFMERVVAWPGPDGPGYVNAHWQAPEGKGGGMRGRPFKELHEFMDFVQYAAAKPGTYKEIFYCLSTQKERGRQIHNRWTAHRHASKALLLKAIWIDVDVGKEKDYPTLTDALTAVTVFLKDASLPAPSAIVLSGGGVHVYWISDKPLSVGQWRPYAEGLKAEVLRVKLCKDAGVITDCARVLRVPGTFNNKIAGNPRPVKVVHLGGSYDFAVEPGLTRLVTLAPPAPVAPVTSAVTAAFALPDAFKHGPAAAFSALDPTNPAENLAAGIGRANSDLPLDPAEVIKGCTHFRDCAVNHGTGQSQGLWALTLLASSWFEDGERWAHYFSKGYPTYNRDETSKKYAEKLRYKAERDLGWPSCHAFEGEGAKCKTCPFYNKLRSPLNLAERAVPPEPPPPSIQQQADAEELDLPDGYTTNSDGCIVEAVDKMDRDGNSETVYVPLFQCRLRNFRAQAGDRRLLFETSLDRERWGPVNISEGIDLVNETSIIKALRQFGVKPNPRDTSNARRIITFMTSFMAKLDAAKERQLSVPFGWLRADDSGALPIGFAYGGRVCMNDGSERVAGYSDQQLERFYKPKGSPDPWWELLHMVTAQRHPALETIIASSFAAPLSFATGLYNGVICSWSPESGARKSTSIAIGAAVWGCPKLTKERPKSSQKGILKKLGLIKALPVYWDEINKESKMDEVQDILGDVTEGAGGTKLNSNRDITGYDEWQTLMQVGANKSLVENVFRTAKGTDAQLQRVFEYKVEKRAGTEKSHEIDRKLNSLDYNYGHMGLSYSKKLGTDTARIDKMVLDALDRFSTEVAMQPEERFRCAIAATIYVGAVLANELGCDFHVDDIWEFMKARFIEQRGTIKKSDIVSGTANNSANALTQFMKTYTDNALWVGNLPVKAGAPRALTFIAGPNTQRARPVHIRLAVADRFIDISKTKFFGWMVTNEITPSAVMDGLAEHFHATEPGRFNLAAGSGVLGGEREPVIRIPVPPGSPFETDLFAHTPMDQRPIVVAPLVTTAVTAAVSTTANMAPVTPTGIMNAAMAQAGSDLAVVRAAP